MIPHTISIQQKSHSRNYCEIWTVQAAHVCCYTFSSNQIRTCQGHRLSPPKKMEQVVKRCNCYGLEDHWWENLNIWRFLRMVVSQQSSDHGRKSSFDTRQWTNAKHERHRFARDTEASLEINNQQLWLPLKRHRKTRQNLKLWIQIKKNLKLDYIEPVASQFCRQTAALPLVYSFVGFLQASLRSFA